ncbi:MAG TPA: peptide ABC transporter substrate-binding protein [Candidatus Limnocylindria bacterium]|nr:peptide ABC transporter substrate-binding protein [Candidatus Limnocylindria bacterium]
MSPDSAKPAAVRRRRALPALIAAATLLVSGGLYVWAPWAGPLPAVAQDGEVRLRIAGSAPFTWDPALAGDASSAGMLAQVFEGLTAFDAESRVQPALAGEWDVQADGRRIVFTLREGLRYSDGTAIEAQHVVDSWLRLIDPARPSPLASLLADVSGALDYLGGNAGAEQVGLRADGRQVIVDLRRPATYFLAVTASPSLAVVPPAMSGALAGPLPPAGIVVSGAYVPTQEAGLIRLAGNANYWAGLPPLDRIDVLTDLGGRSPVAVFEAGEVDYTPVAGFDASWLRYDAQLGPQLRRTESFSVHYYGFDSTAAPFDDARVRLAFAQAVDWERIVRLGNDTQAAGSLVPPGIPGRGDESYRPAHDPEAARRLLAEAGFPDGDGFPAVPLISFGYGYEVTVATELEAALGISLAVEILEFGDYIARLDGDDRPAFWTLSWIADYPHAHDFLGLLLETGSSSNYGRWSNADYDAAIEAAAATNDEEEQAGHYATAQAILREQAPIVPVEYGDSWALSRDGLLGALESGVGLIRYAGLDWAPGTGR